MQYPKSSLALAVFAAVGLAACGGGDTNIGTGGSNTGGGNTGGDSTGGDSTGGGSASVFEITDDPTDLNDRGEWGSLVLSGYGTLNATTAENQAITEASPASVNRFFGGLNNSDSSGTVTFAVVAETGTAFRQDSEVQGITIEAAGAGTLLQNIQVINSDDDGLEWFGGAADVRNLVVQAPTDDPFDQDSGWQGTGKKALAILGPNATNRGMESDGNGDDFSATPKTSPRWTNVTILGNRGNSGDTSLGALHREGYGGKVFRSVYTDDTRGAAEGTGQFQDGCLDVDDEVDEDLEYGDVVFNCNPQILAEADDDGETPSNSWQQDFQDANYNSREGAANNVVGESVSIDASTLAVTPQNATTTAAFDGPFTTNEGNSSVTPDDYFGAVDPNAAAADDDPNNGGPFWDGWTYRNSALSTNLPGSNANFHPLQAEIGDGTISPASTNQCSSKANGLAEGEEVDVFGQPFPVCVIRDGDLDGNFTLTNDHIYVLDGTVQVGNGDREAAAQTQAGSIPDDVQQFTLELEPGTQVFGIAGTEPSLVITRGSQIDAEGTRDRPIIFGAVAGNFL